MTPEIEKLFPGIGALPTSFIVDRESRVVQKHVGMLTARTTESRDAAPRRAAGQRVDRGVRSDPGTEARTTARRRRRSRASISRRCRSAKRTEALQKLNAQPCTCGCDLTVARCRVDDPSLRRQPSARPPDRQADRRDAVVRSRRPAAVVARHLVDLGRHSSRSTPGRCRG